MMRATNLLFFICFWTCLNSSKGNPDIELDVWGLLCAQCGQADPGCRSGNILPTSCDGGERYCFVLQVYSSRRQGTFRGCVDKYDSEGCAPVVINQKVGTVCTSVCDWSGCNSSHRDVLALLVRNR